MKYSTRNAFIQGIGTAVPEYRLSQQEFHEKILRRSYSDKEKRFLSFILKDSGIEGRNLVLNLDQNGLIRYKGNLFEEQCTLERNKVFAAESKHLVHRAASKCLEASKTLPEKVTHLISVTCTGFTNPGFDIDLISSMGIPQTVQRATVGFMGCYAALPSLMLAKAICESQDSAIVLIVCAELCSLHFHPDGDKEDHLSSSLFADGTGAILVTSQSFGSTLTVGEPFSTIVPDSESDMAWNLSNKGFDIRLSSYVSKAIGTNIKAVLPPFWLSKGEESTHWAVHPGGKSILDKVEQSLDLSDSSLDASRQTLKNHGNMSSATLLFVLQRMIEERKPGSQNIINMLGFGPGLTVSGLQLETI